MQKQCSTISALLTAVLLGGAPALAQQQPVRAGTIPHETYRLPNGLRVILAQDRSAPVVAVDVWYDVGSRNERPGLTGFAHLFEHMMFQGSENVGKAEHMTLIERAGGSMNGTTNEDRTNYFETLPSNRLNLGLWLEADRMRSLAITEENLKNQQEVVKEERRLRVENAPYAESFYTAAYTLPYNAETCFSYGHTVIGSMDDLNAATIQDVQDFFRTYYSPSNATLTVVGDFDPAETKQMIQQYFGTIPQGPAPPAVRCETPFSHLPARKVVEDKQANLPAVFMSYGTPPAGNPDTYALSLLASILGNGQSSRLNQRLVKQERAALQAGAGANIRRGPGLVTVTAIANQGVDAARLEKLLDEEIQRLVTRGATASELEKAKNEYRARAVMGRQTALGKAEALQHYAHFHGDPAAVQTDLERYMAVTLADVQRVARQYLVPNNRAVVITQPVSAARGGAQ